MLAESLKATDLYGAALREIIEQQSEQPGWLRQFRESAFENFEQLGFPTVELEEWKYTNVLPIAKKRFAPVLQSNGDARVNSTALSSWSCEEARKASLVFVNGIFRRDLSAIESLPAGVIAIELTKAIEDAELGDSIRTSLLSAQKSSASGFALLNSALFVGGLFLKIPRGLDLRSPVQLLFVSESNKDETAPASFPRVIIQAEAHSQATIIESYVTETRGAYLTNAVIDFLVDENARLKHYRLQREGRAAYHVALTRAMLGRNAAYRATSINLGAALSRHDIAVTMDHEGAECAVDGLYMVGGSQHTDTHSVIDHRQPNCKSHQLYKGILDGKSRAVFNGKVFVRHGAQQTDARQTNKNLLLSNEAQVDTKPQLEIYADDVKCSHGAAVGQLDEDEMFYLESRGIRPARARNLLTYGFAEEVIEKIEIESIRQHLNESLMNTLATELNNGDLNSL